MAPVSLNTISWGRGERDILLLHGITSNAAGWWRVGADLAERGWRAVAPDLRGHGDSPKPGSYGFDEHVDDVLDLGSWDAVLAHSMGGTIAVLCASADPAWADGIVLQDPALMLPEPKSDVLDWLLEEYVAGPDPGRIAEMSPRWHPRDVEIKVEALRASTREMIVRTVDQNWPWLVLDEAKELPVPTVILGSDPLEGGIMPIAFGEWLAQSPLIEFQVIRKASHSAHRDADLYDTYLSALVAALDRLPTLG